jgi:hypothetical protein
LCPSGGIHGRTHRCTLSLLKVREGKYKGEDDASVGGIWRPKEYASALQVLLKPPITYGKRRTRRFPSNNQ